MNKKSVSIIEVIIGMALFILGGIVFKEAIPKNISGVCIGIGASLFGVGVSSFWFNNFCKKNPDELKQSEIEFSDERNTMIRNKAKAKVGDIIQWLIMGIAYITIVIDAPLWVTLVVVGVFLLKNALEVYFMNKFQKEL